MIVNGLFHSVFSKSLAPALAYGGNSQSPVLSVCHLMVYSNEKLYKCYNL